MAQNKNSFLLYCDIIHTVKKLTDEQAGNLFKHILMYVNDENPTADNVITELTFEPIKQSLKRDLIKYEEILKKRSEAGKRSAESKKQNQQMSTSVESVKQTSTNSTDSVSDSVIVSDSVSDSEINNNKFNFKKSLIDLSIEKNIVEDWLKVRKTKKAVNSQTAFESIQKEILKSGISANECIKKAVENSWSGFRADWIKQPIVNYEQKMVY